MDDTLTKNWKSVPLPTELHKQITKAIRKKIGYNNQLMELKTSTATLDDIWKAHKDVYKEFGMESLLEAVKPFFK